MRAALAIGVLCGACAAATACSGWSPSRPFERDAPSVREAIVALDAGDAAAAAAKLEEYLSTGPCKDGSIGTPDTIARRADGTLDLGLSLFRLGEQFGGRFGDEEQHQGVSEASRAQRHAQIICARQLLQAISDDATGFELRAEARYLDGNLAFLDGEYEEAVRAYDRALAIAPGVPDGGDPVGRDAAWNRAIALQRIEDKKDAGNDASPPDASHDASGGDGAGGGGPDASHDDHDAGGQDAASPNQQPDAGPEGEDGGHPPPEERPDADDGNRDAAPPAPPLSNEDDRMLDQLENAPTLQQEQARRFAKRRVRGMVDK